MKLGSTTFLRGVVLAIGVVVLMLCIFVLPRGIADTSLALYHPILLGMYVTAVPFFVALHQTLKLLGYIDHDEAFSEASVAVLGHVKQCAVTIAALFAVGLPYLYFAARHTDAPGIFAFGLVVVFASVVIAVFAAVLQKILKSAIDIKSENDLTV